MDYGDSGHDEEEERWFEAEELARITQIGSTRSRDPGSSLDSGSSRDRGRGQLCRHLEEIADRPALDIATLPGWPGASRWGSGWGGELADAIGAIGPGWIAALGGDRWGFGAALVRQLGDGLAFLAEQGKAPPVFFWTREDDLLVWSRSLARWTGLDLRCLHYGAAAVRGDREQTREGIRRAQRALQEELSPLSSHRLRLGDLPSEGKDLNSSLEAVDEALRPHLGPTFDWPIVVVEGIEDWLEPWSRADLPAALASVRRVVDARRWCLLGSLGRTALGGKSDPSLDPWLDLRLSWRFLRGAEPPQRQAQARVAHLRYRPGSSAGRGSFEWEPATGRLSAQECRG